MGLSFPKRRVLTALGGLRNSSNDDWTHPHDPHAKITKMQDGRTHLAHKAEQAVDLETGAVVGVTVQDADEGDTTTSRETLIDSPLWQPVGPYWLSSRPCSTPGRRVDSSKRHRVQRCARNGFHHGLLGPALTAPLRL
jgi:hypothetical protein